MKVVTGRNCLKRKDKNDKEVIDDGDKKLGFSSIEVYKSKKPETFDKELEGFCAFDKVEEIFKI